MLTLHFDFRTMTDRQAFYRALAQQSACPMDFGNNLDALWDWLTGGMALPATFYLQYADDASGSAEFAPLLALLEEAQQQLDGELRLVRE